MDNVDSSVKSSHTFLDVTAAMASAELFLCFWLPLQQKIWGQGKKKGGGRGVDVN